MAHIHLSVCFVLGWWQWRQKRRGASNSITGNLHAQSMPTCVFVHESWTTLGGVNTFSFYFIWNHGWTPSLPFFHSLLPLSRQLRRLVKRSWRQNKKWNCILCLQEQTFLLLSTLGTRRETLLEQRYNACMSMCDCQPNKSSLVFWCIFLSLPCL